MRTLTAKEIQILEDNDWSISSYIDDGKVEIGKYSPAGEDFYVLADVENFAESMSEIAEDFDVDEHIEMLIEAKQHGLAGVPSTKVLVHDAEDIKKMLQEIADALRETAA